MYYIWQHNLWNRRNLQTVDGRDVQIIDTGTRNNDAGPDFHNAKIKIDGQLWSGDVEMHVRASDWYRHHHDSDKAYDSVILHVVEKDDIEVFLPTTGRKIPQVIMPFNSSFPSHYRKLMETKDTELPCRDFLADVPDIIKTDWLTALTFERVLDKCDRIQNLMQLTVNNREEVCYILLARALGSGTNGDSFQRLAMSAPLRMAHKHSDNRLILESFLFGQAGFLNEDDFSNPYYCSLKKEYQFLKAKFGLIPPSNLNWKHSRMRPNNFPHRRIALLASFLKDGFRLVARILECENASQAMEVFNVELTGYWQSHYNFAQSSVSAYHSPGQLSLESLVINVAVPLIYESGMNHPNIDKCQALQNRAIEMLEQLTAEKNFITRMFKNHGIRCDNAFHSQALIQLFRNYCSQKKCIYCRIGHRHLASKALTVNA